MVRGWTDILERSIEGPIALKFMPSSNSQYTPKAHRNITPTPAPSKTPLRTCSYFESPPNFQIRVANIQFAFIQPDAKSNKTKLTRNMTSNHKKSLGIRGEVPNTKILPVYGDLAPHNNVLYLWKLGLTFVCGVSKTIVYMSIRMPM